MLAEIVYGVPSVVIFESAQRAVSGWDLVTSMIKSWVFGTIIAIVSHTYAQTLLCISASIVTRICLVYLSNL